MQLSWLGVLGVVFLVLKLCHVIAWSWWLVLLPFYGGAAIGVAALVVFGVAGGLFANRVRKKMKKSSPFGNDWPF